MELPKVTKGKVPASSDKYERLVEIEVLAEEDTTPIAQPIQSSFEQTTLTTIPIDESKEEFTSSQSQLSTKKDHDPQKSGKDASKTEPKNSKPHNEELMAIAAKMSTAEKKLTMRRLLTLAKAERKILILGVIFTLFGAMLALISPVLMGAIIDSISSDETTDNIIDVSSLGKPVQLFCAVSSFGCHNNYQLLKTAVFTLFIIALFSAFFSFGKWYTLEMAGERLVARIRKTLFASILSQEIAMFDVSKTGELVNRLSTDTTVLKTACTVQIAQSLQSIVSVTLSIIYVFYLSWSLSLIMLSVLPVVVCVGKRYGKYYRRQSKINQEVLAEATDIATESISLIRTVKSFSNEDMQQKLYNEAIEKTYQQGLKMAMARGIWMGFFVVISNIGIGAVLWYGATEVIKGKMSSGSLATYVLLTLQIGFSFSTFINLYSNLMKALGASERVFQLIDRQSLIPPTSTTLSTEMMSTDASYHQLSDYFVSREAEAKWFALNNTDATSLQSSQRISGEVICQNIEFSYPTRPERVVLTGVNFTIKPGKMIALVGSSGSGKSTIAKLVMRFYDPNQGEVLIDGNDIREYNLRALHTQIGFVSQEPVLFARSILDNITYGIRDNVENGMYSNENNGDTVRRVSMEQVIAASKAANCHEFIQTFPEKYDTLVGERGIRLSGGQKQRVAIARAILMDPCLLVLDEATSALDAESEYLVQDALDRVMVGRSVLVIAHRLSTVRRADNVIVLDNGTVVESGTHDQLLESKDGVYSKLVSRQLLG